MNKAEAEVLIVHLHHPGSFTGVHPILTSYYQTEKNTLSAVETVVISEKCHFLIQNKTRLLHEQINLVINFNETF